MGRIYKTDEAKSIKQGLTASEIRKLPKAERDRILEEQFKLGGQLYIEDPDSIIQASQRIFPVD
jgi:hypothetical protein